MTNAPEKCETWRFKDEGPDRPPPIYFVEVPDSKKPFTSTFKLFKEDHTIGNLVRSRLLENRKVRFAGYRNPHPLEMEVHIRVETTDGYTPMQAFLAALSSIEQETVDFMGAFEASLRSSHDSSHSYHQSANNW